MTNEAIPFEKLRTMDIITYYTCVACKRKVLYQCHSPMLRCQHCHSHFLIEDSVKTINARASIKRADESVLWMTLFTNHLETMLVHYNNITGENEELSTIDEDSLCNLFLVNLRHMIVKMNNSGNVVDIQFN